MKYTFIIITVAVLVLTVMSACKTKQGKADIKKTAPVESPDNTQNGLNRYLVNTKWKLVELNGKVVSTNAWLYVDEQSGRINGNLGCNEFSGSYSYYPDDRIKFEKIVKTQKICLDNSANLIEEEFANVLNIADNFYASKEKLVLNRARMAPLAVFKPLK